METILKTPVPRTRAIPAADGSAMGPLAPDLLRKIDAYWRAANYLAVGQIYLFDNPLALLPPQNATGNFVKIVQRLPVRIELTNYDPDTVPLFVGLSVAAYVYYKERPTGPHAGAVLRPLASLPKGPTDATPSPASSARRD